MSGLVAGPDSSTALEAKLKFEKEQRIRRGSDFSRVYNSKQFAADHCLVINGRPRRRSRSRLGLSVSRKVGNAVQRNQWKRLIREAFRLQQRQLPQGWDWVVRPRKGARPELAVIKKSLKKLTKRLNKSSKPKQPNQSQPNRSQPIQSQPSASRNSNSQTHATNEDDSGNGTNNHEPR